MRRTSAPPKVAGSASRRSTASWSSSADGAMQRSDQDFDQIRPRHGEASGEADIEVIHVVDAHAGHAHAARERNPVEIGTAEVEHVERLAADVLRADLRKLVAQDRVAAVGEDHGG